MKHSYEQDVRWIPIEQIRVTNPRPRSKSKFQEIVANISRLGLKKPIAVSPRTGPDGEKYFASGCGEGRLKAFQALGQKEIPALIIDATDEELLLISLTENMARRQISAAEQVWEIANLRERGYRPAEIAGKVDMDVILVRAIIRLLKHGEEQLVQAVVKRRLPIHIALSIATESDGEVQRLLKSAYDGKTLRGSQLLLVRKIISRRKRYGKALWPGRQRSNGKPQPKDLMRLYQQEMTRQRDTITKARLCEKQLLFLVSAFRELYQSEDFVNLLRAEALSTLPKYLADRIHGKGE